MKFWIAALGISEKDTKSWKENVIQWLNQANYNISEKKDDNSILICFNLNSRINGFNAEQIPDDYIIDGNIYFNNSENNTVNLENMSKADGDFSAVIIRDKTIVLHNSKYSTKSIFYYVNGEQIYASNDIRFLLCLSLIPFKISKKSCQLYCTSNTQIMDLYPTSNESFFEEIYLVEPNSSLVFKGNNLNINKHQWKPTNKVNEKNGYKEFRKTLNDVIRNKISFDQKIGIELSGGLDSALILASLIDIGYNPKNIYAFCMSFKDESMNFSNDEIIARKLISDFNVNGYIVYADETLNFWNIDNKKLVNINGPIMSANLYVGETFDHLCVNLGIDILLTGDGGDNILSGNGYVLDSMYLRNRKKTMSLLNQAVKTRKLRKKWNFIYKPILNIGYYKNLWKEQYLDIPYYFTKNQTALELKGRKKFIKSLSKSKYQIKWMKRYMYDFLFPRSAYLQDINCMTDYFHPLYDNRVIDLVFSMKEELVYDVFEKNEYLASKQIIRKGYTDILPSYIIEKAIKTSYGAMNRKRFFNNKNELLRMFHPKNKLYIDDYEIIDREKFYNVLVAVITMTDDSTMQYNLNVRMVEGVVNLELWLSIACQGKDFLLEKSKIKSIDSYGLIEKVGD